MIASLASVIHLSLSLLDTELMKREWIIFLPSTKFSWHLTILPFSIALIASSIFSMMLLFASYPILFPLFSNSGTVKLLICLTASSVVLSTKSSGSALLKLSGTVCSIVLTEVAVISAMISFFSLSVHTNNLLSWISLSMRTVWCQNREWSYC